MATESTNLETLADGRYTLEGVVGEGGFATVYRATDSVLSVPRAIKILSANASRRKTIKHRLNAEARAMARISHPNVLRVYDIVTEAHQGRDLHYVVMDLAPGGNLMDWTRANGCMPPDLAMRYMVQVLSALAAAHAAGIVHRDVKPQNILLDKRGVALLADFGIALLAEDGDMRATRTGVAMGSFAYMAPEQRIDARSVGPSADLYAVATSLYYLVTGSNPVDLFAAEPGSDRWTGLPLHLAVILQRATAHDPLERFLDARSFAQALLDALDHVGSEPLTALQPWDPSSFPAPSDHFSGVASTQNLAASLDIPSVVVPNAEAVRQATREAHTFLEAIPPVGPGSTAPALTPDEIRALGPLQRRLMGASPTIAERPRPPAGAVKAPGVAGTLVVSDTDEPAPRRGAWLVGLAALALVSALGIGLASMTGWRGDEATVAARGAAAAPPVGGAPGAGAAAGGEAAVADEIEPDEPGEPAEPAEPVADAEDAAPAEPIADAAPAESTAPIADLAVADADLTPPPEAAPDYGTTAVGGVWVGTFVGARQIAVTLVLSGADPALSGVMESRVITVASGPAQRFPVSGSYDPSSGALVLEDDTEHSTAGVFHLTRAGDSLSGTLTLRTGPVRPISLSRPKP